jgi:hypothetical protein
MRCTVPGWQAGAARQLPDLELYCHLCIVDMMQVCQEADRFRMAPANGDTAVESFKRLDLDHLEVDCWGALMPTFIQPAMHWFASNTQLWSHAGDHPQLL